MTTPDPMTRPEGLSAEEREALDQASCPRHRPGMENFICRPCCDAHDRAVEALLTARLAAQREDIAKQIEALNTFHIQGYATSGDEAWGRNPICDDCGKSWPCDTAELTDHAARIARGGTDEH